MGKIDNSVDKKYENIRNELKNLNAQADDVIKRTASFLNKPETTKSKLTKIVKETSTVISNSKSKVDVSRQKFGLVDIEVIEKR